MNSQKNNSENIFDIIIIGSGPTGLYGAFQAGLKHLNTLIIEINNTYGGAPARLYPEKPLYDIPGVVCITGAELVENLYQQLSNTHHWNIVYNTEIIEIIKHNSDELDCYYELIEQHQIHYYTKNIIFASGYGAFEFISFDSETEVSNNQKISYHITCLDHYKNKEVIICGGGDSAVDFANSLKGITKCTNLIHRRNEFRAKQANVQKLIDHVNLHLNKTIYKVEDNCIHFYDNDTNQKEHLYFDELLVLFGTKMVPNNIKLDNLYNHLHKIEVNPLTLESINYPHLYACGLATNIKQEQTIVTGISDIIKVVAQIHKQLKK